MILLDSDHLTVLRYRSSERATRLFGRLEQATDLPVGTTIINVEEVMRGWLAAIAKERQPHRQTLAYRELAELFTFFTGYHIALFEEAASKFLASALRIGWMPDHGEITAGSHWPTFHIPLATA